MTWVTAGYSETGSSHKKDGKGCEDAFRVKRIDDLLFIAVSDGASSAVYSADGAIAAVNACEKLFLQKVAEEYFQFPSQESLNTLLYDMLAAARETIESTAKQSVSPSTDTEQDSEQDQDIHNYACTLLIFLAGKDWFAAAHIGDGAIVAQFQDGEINAIVWPQNGEYANITWFITSPDYQNKFETVFQQRPIQSVAVFSDGIEYMCLDFISKKAQKQFFIPIFQTITDLQSSSEALATYIKSLLNLPFIQERSDDDLTLALGGKIYADTNEQLLRDDAS